MMNDDPQTIERDLRALAPRALSAATQTRIRAAMPQAERTTRVIVFRRPRLGLVALASAAALVVAVLLVSRPGRPIPEGAAASSTPMARPAAVTRYEPYACGRIFIAGEDVGPIRTADGAAVRGIRCLFVDRVQWRDRGTGRSISATIPHAEVYAVAMNVN